MPVPYKQFLLRRLHSLTGLGIGLFLMEHFFTNAHVHQGEESFNEAVAMIQGIPHLIFIEIGLLLLPFAFHIIYGLVIIAGGQSNVYDQSRPRNWLYFLQRASAFPILAFLIFHVVTLRLAPRFFHPDIYFNIGEGEPNFFLIMSSVFNGENGLLYCLIYVVGISCGIFHFANGIATACITWGLTIGKTSQRIVGYACAGLGFTMVSVAVAAVFGFRMQGPEALSHIIEEAPQTVSYLVETARAIFA